MAKIVSIFILYYSKIILHYLFGLFLDIGMIGFVNLNREIIVLVLDQSYQELEHLEKLVLASTLDIKILHIYQSI